jgi:hypothetical protein
MIKVLLISTDLHSMIYMCPSVATVAAAREVGSLIRRCRGGPFRGVQSRDAAENGWCIDLPP